MCFTAYKCSSAARLPDVGESTQGRNRVGDVAASETCRRERDTGKEREGEGKRSWYLAGSGRTYGKREAVRSRGNGSWGVEVSAPIHLIDVRELQVLPRALGPQRSVWDETAVSIIMDSHTHTHKCTQDMLPLLFHLFIKLLLRTHLEGGGALAKGPPALKCSLKMLTGCRGLQPRCTTEKHGEQRVQVRIQAATNPG